MPITRLFNSLFIFLLIVAISGCNENTVTFDNAGPIDMVVGETLTNSASGSGSTPVEYSSSDTTIATVNQDGQVTAVGAGSAVITASQAADANYTSASASYTVNVTQPANASGSVPFSAWIGGTDTQVTFSDTANGMDFYRSSEPGCNVANYASCTDGQLDVLNGSPVTDSAVTLSQVGYYVLKDGNRQGALTVSAGNFLHRTGHQVVEYNNRLWLIGGSVGTARNDVWSSTDGVNWKQRTAAAAFSPRTGHQVIVYNNQLWLIGGRDADGNYQNDVWSSSDGINWTQQTAAAAFTPRYGYQVVAFNNQMWLIGGNNPDGTSSHLNNDVWSSSDGINWTQQTAAAAFSARYGHQVVVYNNQMWLIGGYVGGYVDTIKNDVWSSSDGINWTEQTSAAAFSPSAGHKVVVYDNQLWMIEGENAVWSSSDGINWTQRAADGAFSHFLGHEAVAYNNRLWLIGGEGDVNDAVWSSGDGVAWTQQIATAPAFSPRAGHQLVAYHNQLWLIGGEDYKSYTTYPTNEVWSSPDGLHWTQKTSAAAFSARSGYQVVVFNDQMWLIGGFEGSVSKNDVWSSTDGVTWTLRNASAGFPARSNHQVVVYNNQLWLIGGVDNGPASNYVTNTVPKNDVWSSSDGITWIRRTAAAPFSGRDHHQVVVYDNKLWVIGGSDIVSNLYGRVSGSYKNDVWSSSDGINWTQQTADAAFTPRTSHQVVVFNNRMWLIGGKDSNGGARNDVWSSTDGITWTQQAPGAFSGRFNHQVVVFGGHLMLVGGNDSNIKFDLENDVWSSDDGINWRLGYLGAFQLQ